MVIFIMNTKTNNHQGDGNLSEEQKEGIRNMCKQLFDYYKTAEGKLVGEQISRIVDSMKEKDKPKPVQLTEKEQLAFAYIKGQLSHGIQPTVRGVAKAVGLKSSRSGVRIIDKLIAQGYLRLVGEKGGLRALYATL